MKPGEILAAAIAHFPVLYLDTETVLPTVLKMSLEAYQDKAGVIETITTPADSVEVAVPSHLLEIASVEDAVGQYAEAVVGDTAITILAKPKHVPPYKISYLVDLKDFGADEDLPKSVVGSLILEHLIASIDILNTYRARRVAMSTGQENDFPSDQELRERKASIETSMEETATAFIPIITIR